MVVPRRHVASLDALTADEYRELMDLVRSSVALLESVCHPTGVNVGMNLGAAAGAGIAEHLHIHIVPRWFGDTNFMAVIGGARVISQSVEHAWALLRPAFVALDSSAT